jgi:DNA-3-methyladenine glycosylase II
MHDTLELLLMPRPPYDFALTARAARYYSVLGRALEWNGSVVYRRALRCGAAIALVELTSVGTIEQPRVLARLLASAGAVDQAALTRQLERLLNLDSDRAPFYAAAADPALRATIERLYGLSAFQAGSLFEALAITMIEQQIALRMAQQAERWLIEQLGESLSYEGETYAVFPAPERIAALTVDDLRPLKITFQRMARLIALAQSAASGSLDLEEIRALPLDEAYAAVRAIPGVGHWTAAWALLRACGHYLYFGSADVALRAAVNAYHFGAEGRAAALAVDELFARYRPHDGIAAYYTLMRWAFDRYPA